MWPGYVGLLLGVGLGLWISHTPSALGGKHRIMTMTIDGPTVEPKAPWWTRRRKIVASVAALLIIGGGIAFAILLWKVPFLGGGHISPKAHVTVDSVDQFEGDCTGSVADPGGEDSNVTVSWPGASPGTVCGLIIHARKDRGNSPAYGSGFHFASQTTDILESSGPGGCGKEVLSTDTTFLVQMMIPSDTTHVGDFTAQSDAGLEWSDTQPATCPTQ